MERPYGPMWLNTTPIRQDLGDIELIITTKKGQKGVPKINFSTSLGFDKVSSRIDLVDNYGWAEIINEANDNAEVPRQALADEEFNPDINTDWQDVVFSKNASVYDANLSISGGGEKSMVYFSVNKPTNQEH